MHIIVMLFFLYATTSVVLIIRRHLCSRLVSNDWKFNLSARLYYTLSKQPKKQIVQAIKITFTYVRK